MRNVLVCLPYSTPKFNKQLNILRTLVMELTEMEDLLERIADALDEAERNNQERHTDYMDKLSDIESKLSDIESRLLDIDMNTM